MMKSNKFLCGVIEGYYGRPWSFHQRQSLFEYCLRFGLNTYVYAPKDDAKHRSRWRDLYTNEEANQLSELIQLAKQNGLNFIYALSPGLDIRYSSEKDFQALKTKFDQLSGMGCEYWALLFDDIENEMCQEDQDHYSSFAHAQVDITNRLFNYLNKPNIFIFCPTEYCTRMAKPTLENSDYLQTIGTGLDGDIDIFWTGPKVVSRRITVSHILSVNSVLKRRVTIWDNLNANDYDQRRLCLGPFSGRSSDLSSKLNGMLTNPNCEFHLNFIPLNTLGQWFQSLTFNRIDDENIERYNVERSFEQALIQWLPEFNLIKSANEIELIPDEDSTKVHRMECDVNSDLTIDDIRLLVELFHLPYENGRNAQAMYSYFYWLRLNSNCEENDWHSRALLFHNFVQNVSCLLRKLLSIANRALLYDVYFYILDINSTLDLCSQYLHWLSNTNILDGSEKRSIAFMSGDVEPWSIRGGLAGEFLNILPLGDFQSIIKPELNSLPEIYFLRSITSDDRASMYALSTTVSYQDDQHSEIVADKLIGGYLFSLADNYEYCFAIENSEDHFCGFVLTIHESEKYDKLIEKKWIEQLHQKYPDVNQNFFELTEYPQWIYDQYSIRVQFFIDLTLNNEKIFQLGKKLLKIIVKHFQKKGCTGCHTLIDERNVLLHQFYFRLGFLDIPILDQNDQIILLGKLF